MMMMIESDNKKLRNEREDAKAVVQMNPGLESGQRWKVHSGLLSV
jgi:hypothetical protein